jgi:hypothetical protein
MNNLSSYCGLVDAKIRASDKDLLVKKKKNAQKKIRENDGVDKKSENDGVDKKKWLRNI